MIRARLLFDHLVGAGDQPLASEEEEPEGSNDEPTRALSHRCRKSGVEASAGIP